MPKFTILWLFALTTILAILFAVAGQSLQYAYLLSCLSLACYAGFAARYLFVKSHAASMTIAAITSVAVGGCLLAIGSRHTLIAPGAVDAVSESQQSLAASFLVGAGLGYCFSVIPMLAYALVIGYRAYSSR